MGLGEETACEEKRPGVVEAEDGADGEKRLEVVEAEDGADGGKRLKVEAAEDGADVEKRLEVEKAEDAADEEPKVERPKRDGEEPAEEEAPREKPVAEDEAAPAAVGAKEKGEAEEREKEEEAEETEVAPAYGFVKQAADSPRASYHDYIIVGGGTAGCPLAATLSKRFDVLVLERGGSPYGNANISKLASFIENLAYLTPTSPAQRFVSEDGVINTRARCLGGGTCINAGFYSRASRLEVKDMGLNPKLADQSFQWVERELVFWPQLTEWTSAYRAGLLEAGVTPDNGFTYQHLDGTKVGGTTFDPTGHRHTAADLLRYADPARITVLLRATAQMILFRNVTGQHKNPQQAADSPRASYHDYIIVGGGTAGCPLAATLSKRFDVLVLERGGSPYGNANISNLASFIENLAYLTPTSPAQRFVSEDGVINTRARCLGGGTCINAGFYSRASRRELMDMRLNPKLAHQSFQWVERELVFWPQLTEWTSAFRAGLLEAGVTADNGFTYQHLDGTKVGGTTFDPTGHRHTAADLLRLAICKPESSPTCTAYGVVYKDEADNIHEARLKGFSAGEIILSAGALGSPQLLMLSGVDPADHLKSFGIEVVLDQPMVGHGIADNPMNIFDVPSPEALTITSAQAGGIRPGYYVESLTGFNLDAALLGGNSPTVPYSFQGGVLVEKLARPLSRGYLRLKNLDPEDNPSVTYNYFTEPEDLRTCVEALQTVMRVIDTQALSEFRYPNQTVEYLQALTASLVVNNRARSPLDATSLDQFCKDLVLTFWHFHGGCEVGKVVDHEYRVIGVGGLRVIDGSTFSFSPGTNPQATLLMLGRYMGILIGYDGVEPSLSGSSFY
ncbi:protein HOTHEAD-like [Zingiber officinale]|uniref:protein HOTHEAD-like n=1 Tax=Zingiber officinale TaxID=94328 RepID=UPI001C4CF14E|nr:protein HOTHEAD-like [Zingiber officinale]